MYRRLTTWLFSPVDIAPLIFFRVCFGGLMLWEVWRYFNYDRISRYFVEPSYFFHYFGFEWVKPLPGDGMFLLFHGLGLLSVLIMFGALYRLSMTLFFISFTYVFLLDKAQYLNHFYLVSLVSFLMIFIPAHRSHSVDALLRPSLRARFVPRWSLDVLRAQMAIVYFFGGLAKLNPDWFAGEPLRQWMAERTDFPFIGHLFREEWMVALFSAGGLLIDLFIVPLLLWKPTRIPALLLATTFHLMNSQLFNIGIFPWFAIGATLMFMPPAWFRRLLAFLPGEQAFTGSVGFAYSRWITVGILLYFAVQVLLPLRHWLYPGDPSWTEEGHTLAWHMRLRSKSGDIAFYLSDPDSGSAWQVDARDYLTSRQFDQMKDNPDMILRFSHHLADLHRDAHPNIRVHVRAMISLNSREPQLLIDPTADLAQMPDSLLAADWILPLMQQPVPHRPVPALLVSRRYDGALLLLNAAQTVYPLDGLMLQAGEQQISAADFGVTQLLPGECLLAHTQSAPLRDILVPCDETGSRVIIASTLVDEALQVYTPSGTADCPIPLCIIAH